MWRSTPQFWHNAMPFGQDGNHTIRGAATIAGLIERNLPQGRKTGRQATISSDILYDTLSKYDPDHLMMQITREEALRGLVDLGGSRKC